MTKIFFIKGLFIFALITVLGFTPIKFGAHEAYLSVTKLTFNKASNSFECEMKITAHDLEKSLKIISGKPVILDKESMRNSNNKLLSQYLQNKFHVKINDEKIYLDFVGYEIETNDDGWIYFEIKYPKKIEKMELSNLLLTETFSLQQNVTHNFYKEQKQSFVFTKLDTHQIFNWNE